MLFKHDTLHIFYTIGILGSQITILMNIIDQIIQMTFTLLNK